MLIKYQDTSQCKICISWLIKYSWINSRNWIRCHVMSDDTLHSSMTPLTVEDQLLIKTSQTENDWTVEKMITELPARQWKWHMLFDLLRITESTGFTGLKG